VSKNGKSYLDELVIKCTINWHSNLKIFIFDQFLQKNYDVTPCKKCKMWQNFNFSKFNQNKYGLLALGFSCTKQSAFWLENPFIWSYDKKRIKKFLFWT